jgi:outer membrane protein TolC
MKKNISTIILISILSSLAQAQDSLQLTLAHATEETLKNNREIALANLDQQIAAAKYNQTNAVFLPQINLSYTAFTTNNPLNAFGFKLQQQSIAASDFNPQLLNNPSATQNYMAKAEWNQPIINMDMIAMRKAVHTQVDVYAYKTKRTQEYLTFEVQRAYAQLQVAHQAVAVLTEALQTVKTIYKSTNDYFEKGRIQKSDLLQVQVQLTTTESKLAEAKSNVKNASDYLSLLMGSKTGAIYSTPALEKINEREITEAQVPANRSDFQALQSALQAQDQMLNSGKFSYLPKLNAFANYFLNDNSALGFKSNSYLAGAQLSWNIFNGTSIRNKVSEYKSERNKIEQQLTYQKEQAQLELDKTNRQQQDAAFAIRQQETAVAHATEALRIMKDRYEQGLVSTNDLLQAQTLLSQQKLFQAQAIMQYNVTSAYREFLTTTSEK